MSRTALRRIAPIAVLAALIVGSGAQAAERAAPNVKIFTRRTAGAGPVDAATSNASGMFTLSLSNGVYILTTQALNRTACTYRVTVKAPGAQVALGRDDNTYEIRVGRTPVTVGGSVRSTYLFPVGSSTGTLWKDDDCDGVNDVKQSLGAPR